MSYLGRELNEYGASEDEDLWELLISGAWWKKNSTENFLTCFSSSDVKAINLNSFLSSISLSVSF